MRQSKTPLSFTGSEITFRACLTHQITHSDKCISAKEDTLLARVHFPRLDSINDSGNYASELQLLGSNAACEDWLLAKPGIVEHGASGKVRWSASELFLFAVLRQKISHDAGSEASIVAQTRAVYLTLLEFVSNSPHPHLLRCWNYIPAINRGEGDGEVYKRFCAGRLQAFRQAGLAEEKYPSASAVGHAGNYLTIQLLAGAYPGVHHGNNRQVDAFQYPRQYGASSPSFARATSLDVDGSQLLFISGTASILDHSTCYPNELAGQLQVTIENILHLLKQARKSIADVVSMRVYLRYPKDHKEASSALNAVFPDCGKIFVNADICRAELLVEVECFCT